MARDAELPGGPEARPPERIGVRLAIQLWLASVVCWWVLGLGLSNLWWLVNDHQQWWIRFCYAWEVPVVGWTGAVLLPYLRWRALARRIRAREPGVGCDLARFPWRLALTVIGTSAVGYVLGAIQLALFAHLPVFELAKIVLQGPVIGGLFAVAAYLLGERAVRQVRIPVELGGAAPRGVGPHQSIYTKILSITVALIVAVAMPVFLLGLTQDQMRREEVRGTALRRFVARQDSLAAVARDLYAFGPSTYLVVVDRATGMIRMGRGWGRPVTTLELDHDSLLVQDDEGWFVSRRGTPQVVGYAHKPAADGPGETWALVSVFDDYGRGLLDSAATAATVLAVALVAGLVLATMLARSVADPLVQLRAAASQMAGGDLDVETVAITGGDEVAALAREFDRMATRVREEEARLRAALAELERTQGQLVQAERLSAIGRLVSGVAHELNNPLAAILHYAEDLRADETRPPHDREALDAIAGQSRRCRTIVRDLLSFARGREARRSRVEASELVARVVRAMRPAEMERGARLETRVAEGLPSLVLDADGIEQVLTNLLDNALHAAGKDGTVRLTAEAHGEGWRLVVEDDGPGIPADVLPRIFEPFFTTKPVGQGTGLGLAVSLGIVQRAGGTLRGENRADARGARFTVILPRSTPPLVAEEPKRLLPAERRETAPPGPPPMDVEGRVLVVDDEVVLRTALRRYFHRRGWGMDEAADGHRALELISASAPGYYRAILSDLRMPGLSGVELHDWLAANHPHLLPRLILMTGDVASPQVHQFLARTGCPVLEKPFDLEVLAEALEGAGRGGR